MTEILDLTPAMALDTELTNGMDNNDDRHPMENEPPLPQDDSRPGTPHLTNCEQMKILARNIKYYTITIENIKANIRSLKLHGLNDEDCHIMKEHLQRLDNYTALNALTVSEFSSLPSCDNPACAEHHTPLNTPTKNNDNESPTLPKLPHSKEKTMNLNLLPHPTLTVRVRPNVSFAQAAAQQEKNKNTAPPPNRWHHESVSSTITAQNSWHSATTHIAKQQKTNNYTENKRPGKHTTNIDSDVTNTLTRFFSTPPSSPISPTDPDEICDYMKKLKNSKAPGIDNITNKMIKKFPFKIILIFTYIINKILLLRHFPTEWKVAIVFPIHKPGKNKNSPDAYRPISLLSSLSKIAEHIILNRIKNHIYSTNFLNPNQFGFTQQLSTYHPLLRLTEKISSGFQRGRTTGAVFLDIQKAFDRVWIDGLIYKLIMYNFPPAIIHILYSYLTNRKYKVRVNDTLSITHRVNIGVTQGSLLGPVLFNIYVNDIPSHPRTMINLYADDTAISATYKNTKSVTIALNKHLALLEKYFNDWKIKINVDKTVAVLFTKARKPIAPPTLYSTPLRWSQTTKYLGITFDKTLTWKPHILYARDKFRIALKKLYPLICRNSNMYLYNKVLLYTAVLRPILSYGCPIWGYAANTNIKILETAQNSIIRCIVRACRYNSNENIYRAIKIPPFKKHIQDLAKNFMTISPTSIIPTSSI
ncbi:probable RNA-directed DNA polymerase from transposon BS [Trichonephila clavipes]|nr:probable RNA-directed DNA polymerase from transposon BS [Trichonephila clavipes]